MTGISGAAKLLLCWYGWLIECWDRADHSSLLELSNTVKKCALGCLGRIARAQIAYLSSIGNLGKSVNIFGSMAGLISQIGGKLGKLQEWSPFKDASIRRDGKRDSSYVVFIRKLQVGARCNARWDADELWTAMAILRFQ